jgi:hypothetical protein
LTLSTPDIEKDKACGAFAIDGLFIMRSSNLISCHCNLKPAQSPLALFDSISSNVFVEDCHEADETLNTDRPIIDEDASRIRTFKYKYFDFKPSTKVSSLFRSAQRKHSSSNLYAIKEKEPKNQQQPLLVTHQVFKMPKFEARQAEQWYTSMQCFVSPLPNLSDTMLIYISSGQFLPRDKP